LNNLLATKPLVEIKIDEIDSIARQYNVDLRTKFINQLIGLYLRALNQCLSDKMLDNQDVVNLNHLKNLLKLNDTEVEELHNEEASKIYDKYYYEAISDGKIDNEEGEFLEKLKENIKLPTMIAENISNERRSQFMNTQFKKIAADKRISPYEWNEFETVAGNLNVTIQPEESIEKLKLYWLIENGQLPTKEVQINLQKGEDCYFTCDADWLENRTVTKRINYGGPTARIKIMKGVYYRAGSLAVQRVTQDELHTIDQGQVFITNKRLIFLGSKKNSNIQLNKILSLNPYSDAVGIVKDTGKSPVIKVDEHAEIFTMILSRVINDL
jgi:hypothetical protein